MTGRPGTGTRRARGNIETLASGALRVRVYGGQDPLKKQRHVLTEVIPKGPNAQRDAERARDRLLVQVAERRNPKTSATLDQLLERYLDQLQGSPNTLQLYLPEALCPQACLREARRIADVEQPGGSSRTGAPPGSRRRRVSSRGLRRPARVPSVAGATGLVLQPHFVRYAVRVGGSGFHGRGVGVGATRSTRPSGGLVGVGGLEVPGDVGSRRG
jgi:hypothetical protein